MKRAFFHFRRRIRFSILFLVFAALLLPPAVYFVPADAVAPEDFGLLEGDLVSAVGSDDPDVYIVNEWGYKRLFLNPAIFGFYGHLKWENIRLVSPAVRDTFITSGLFRNCEANDPKVYGVEVSGEDIGTLHWVNVTAEQALAEDADFFQRVFCINNAEFTWYPKDVAYTSLDQVPRYARVVQEEPPILPDFPDVTSWAAPDACFPIIEPEELLQDENAADPPRGVAVLNKDVTTETYGVAGLNAAAVRTALNQYGPLSGDERFDAITTWYISWSYHYQDTGTSCYLVDATINLDVDVLLPEWINELSAPLADQALFNQYLYNLTRHEQGHVNSALLGARQLQDALAGPMSAASCQQLADNINAIGNDWWAEMQQADLDYDERSDHGTSQGAVFPLYCSG